MCRTYRGGRKCARNPTPANEETLSTLCAHGKPPPTEGDGRSVRYAGVALPPRPVGTVTITDGSRPSFRSWLSEFSVMRGCSQLGFFFWC
ncbi:hypothetical protein ALC53_07424 [Atta colombica]|uniref:Uncharacterized protein n=1 Tax=Atta colombica TaxID=520822 RepID=A0A195BC85_9HYME|nr:hypothetical protein ALC53_07424 [Atta colombica]